MKILYIFKIYIYGGAPNIMKIALYAGCGRVRKENIFALES